MTALAAIADTGSCVSDAAFWWFTGTLTAALLTALGIHLRTHRHLCAFCDTPLRTQAERDWGLCAADRDALRDALDRGTW